MACDRSQPSETQPTAPCTHFQSRKKGYKNGNNHQALSALTILQQKAHSLADAVANICLILDPSLVVLGGRIGSPPTLFEATRQIVEQNEFCRPRLALSRLGPDALALGAIWLALKSARERMLPLNSEN